MPGANERHIQNEWIVMALAGNLAENQKPRPVRLEPDRSLSVWSKTVGVDGARERIALLDANGLFRTRPYEPIFPVGGIGPMPGGSTTFFTSTGALSRVYIELVNANDVSGVTVTLSKTNGAVTATIAQAAPVPRGIGIRLGPYDLEDGGTIQGSSSPANSVDIHVIVDRFNATGDTP